MASNYIDYMGINHSILFWNRIVMAITLVVIVGGLLFVCYVIYLEMKGDKNDTG